MTKNKLWQAVKGLTLAAGMAVGIFALGQTDVLADTLTLTVEKNTIGQGMILDPVQVEFTKGDTYTLTYTIVPSDAVGTVSWSSSNNSVASVNGGVVTAVSEGFAIITAKVSNSVYATCKVSVSARPVAVTGVSLSPSSLNLSTKSASRTLDYTISPNGAKPSSLRWESSDSSVVTVDGNCKRYCQRSFCSRNAENHNLQGNRKYSYACMEKI